MLKKEYIKVGNERLSAQYTLYTSLLAIVKMMAPITPFVTEEIYQNYFKKYEKGKSIHISEFPKGEKLKELKDWEFLKNLISKIRSVKTEHKKPMNAPIDKINLPKQDLKIITPYKQDLMLASGAMVVEAGPEFKMEFPAAGTEVTLNKKKNNKK